MWLRQVSSVFRLAGGRPPVVATAGKIWLECQRHGIGVITSRAVNEWISLLFGKDTQIHWSPFWGEISDFFFFRVCFILWIFSSWRIRKVFFIESRAQRLCPSINLSLVSASIEFIRWACISPLVLLDVSCLRRGAVVRRVAKHKTFAESNFYFSLALHFPSTLWCVTSVTAASPETATSLAFPQPVFFFCVRCATYRQ